MSTFTQMTLEELHRVHPNCALHLKGARCGFAQAKGENPGERFLFVLNTNGTVDQIPVEFDYQEDSDHPCGLKLITQMAIAGQLPAHPQLDLIGPAILHKIAVDERIEKVTEELRAVWKKEKAGAEDEFKTVIEDLGLAERQHMISSDAGVMETGIRIRMMARYMGKSVHLEQVQLAAETALPKMREVLKHLLDGVAPDAEYTLRAEVLDADPVKVDFFAELSAAKTVVYDYRLAQERIDAIRPDLEFVNDDDDIMEAFGDLIMSALLRSVLAKMARHN